MEIKNKKKNLGIKAELKFGYKNIAIFYTTILIFKKKI